MPHARHAPRPKTERRCTVCGAAIVGTARVMYCSGNCKQKAYRLRQGQYRTHERADCPRCGKNVRRYPDGRMILHVCLGKWGHGEAESLPPT